MFRILPFLIILLTLMFSSRLLEFVSDNNISTVRNLMAAENDEEKNNKEMEDQAAEEEDGEGKEQESDKETEDMKDEKTEDMEEEKTPTTDDAENMQDKGFSEVEMEVLQSLSKRRESLEMMERKILLKENILRAIAKNIDKKINNLEILQSDLKVILDKYNTIEDLKIRRLIKVYESMKPQDAASIFEDLEMKILLPVASGMKEAKLAMIISKMNINKARELTISIANRRRLDRDKIMQ